MRDHLANAARVSAGLTGSAVSICSDRIARFTVNLADISTARDEAQRWISLCAAIGGLVVLYLAIKSYQRKAISDDLTIQIKRRELARPLKPLETFLDDSLEES